jgi:hypothetical protein
VTMPVWSSARRQMQIVQAGGLPFLLRMLRSSDPDVQRYAAQALANLSCNGQCAGVAEYCVGEPGITLGPSSPGLAADARTLLGEEGGVEALLAFLESAEGKALVQGCKALCNLSVLSEDPQARLPCAHDALAVSRSPCLCFPPEPLKAKISALGGVTPLIRLAGSEDSRISVEAVAALANLAVLGRPLGRDSLAIDHLLTTVVAPCRCLGWQMRWRRRSARRVAWCPSWRACRRRPPTSGSSAPGP